AIITLILNFIFIPIYGAYGAVIVSLIAEALVVLAQIILIRKEINFTLIILKTYKAMIASILMGLAVYFMEPVISSGIDKMMNGTFSYEITTAILLMLYAILGVIVYFTVNLILRTQVQQDILKKIFSIFSKKKS
ncbi:MAG TPA: polysaccharide biosynthesis C-terminal domain-containing protein, partial [Acholeplasma sp.]|nr:polysaccharide biosynthesis C-terminal domain-containing protein [Acholeplasma sp.]